MINLPIDIVHEATALVMSAYTYTQIYSTGTTVVTVNGKQISLAPGMNIPIVVRSISSTAGVFCLGTKTSTLTDPDPNQNQYLGSTATIF